jgi:hypothetical protein
VIVRLTIDADRFFLTQHRDPGMILLLFVLYQPEGLLIGREESPPKRSGFLPPSLSPKADDLLIVQGGVHAGGTAAWCVRFRHSEEVTVRRTITTLYNGGPGVGRRIWLPPLPRSGPLYSSLCNYYNVTTFTQYIYSGTAG